MSDLEHDKKVQDFYDKVYDLLESLDVDNEQHEALLVGTVQALVDKLSASFEDDFHPYLIKDLGDLMHDFCNEYARSFIDAEMEEDGNEEDLEESALSEEGQGE